MELIHRTHKAYACEPGDFISNMPDNVVTNIMDQLPIQDAVRTSILSRNWRFTWTMRSQFVFDKNFCEHVLRTKRETNFQIIINRLFLHLKGAITKFVICVDESSYHVNDDDISHWISFLSTRGIKDLTLEKAKAANTPLLKLPTHLFSCLELKHLNLGSCCLDLSTCFRGFPNLLSLELKRVEIKSGTIGELLTHCPALETLKMIILNLTRKVKVSEFVKLANLRILSLFWFDIENPHSSIIFELVGFLPKLEVLHLDFVNFKLSEGGAEKKFPSTFPSLKTLTLSRIDLNNGLMLACAFEMITSFSNLQNLEISTSKVGNVKTLGPNIDYKTVRQLQLRSLVFAFFAASENEVWLIKFLLLCSPFLKKIVIHPHPHLASNEQLKFAKMLVKLQRAYPLVDMNLY